MNPQAPRLDSDDASDLLRVQTLLPLHAQGLLQGEELEFMQTWLEKNGAQHPQIEADLAWLGTTSTQLKARVASEVITAQPALDAGMHALMQRIRAEQKSPSKRHASEVHISSSLAKFWHRMGDALSEALDMRSPGLAFGVAAVVLVQAGVIGALLVHEPAQQTVLGGTSTQANMPAQTLLTVAFKPNATEQAIRQTLASAEAQISSGPSALGLYMVSVPTVQLEESLAKLSAAKDTVESVTK